MIRLMFLLAAGALLGAALLVLANVGPGEILELLDGARQRDVARLGDAVDAATTRATVRAKTRVADTATTVASALVDAIAERLKAETDRAAADAKRRVADEARGALGLEEPPVDDDDASSPTPDHP